VSLEQDATLGKLRCSVLSGPTHRPQAQTVLAFNAEARPVLDWLLTTRAAFTVVEVCERFQGFTREDVLGLLGWLAHAALIRPVPAPEWEASCAGKAE
jgi:hypothetical protein